MEEGLDFLNMDVSRELASIQFGIDEFDEVNILEGLHSPSPSRSLDFGSLGHNMPNEDQQHGGAEVEAEVEVESSLTESGESQNKEADGEAEPEPEPEPEPTKNPESTEGGGGKCEAHNTVSLSAFSDKRTSLPLSNVPVSVDSFTQLIVSIQQPPILTATQPLPLTFPEGQVSQGTVASLQAQELNYSNLLSSQNENIHMPQLGTGLPSEHSTNNQIVMRNNTVLARNAFNGINQQAYPTLSALILQNPAEVGAGIGTGTLNPPGQFMCSQQHSRMWNSSSWPQYHHGPAPNYVWAPNVYDSQYAPNCMHFDTSVIHRPQQFNTLPQQASHLSGLQKIFDLQNCMLPPCPMFPRPESYSNYQPAFAPMPPNAYDNQRVYRPMPPEPVLPTGPAIFSDYHPQPRSLGMTYNSLGAATSMPQRYPQLQDYQRNPFQSQMLMPNGFAQLALGTAQLSGSPRVSDNRNEQSQLWSSQSSTLRGATTLSRFAGPSVQSSRVPEPSRLNEVSNVQNSRVSWTQKGTGIQLQNAVPAAPNTVISQLNKGQLVNPSSSSSRPISEGIRKILDQTAKHRGPKPKATSSARRTNTHHIQTPVSQDQDETWIKELEKELNRAWNQPDSVTKNQEQAASGGRRRRSPGPPEVAESSSSSKRQKRDSAGKERVETPPNSDEARNTSENEGNEDRDANASDPSPAREFLNSVYDRKFEKMGLPIDPYIRFFKTAEK